MELVQKMTEIKERRRCDKKRCLLSNCNATAVLLDDKKPFCVDHYKVYNTSRIK